MRRDVSAGTGPYPGNRIRESMLVADLDRLLAKGRALEAVEALHTPAEWIVGQHDGQPVRQTMCSECGTLMPCATVRAIREALA